MYNSYILNYICIILLFPNINNIWSAEVLTVNNVFHGKQDVALHVITYIFLILF